ncbi:MAG: thiamine-phosphate synthase family protein [Candidatus Thorarchaeota archaeon]
MNNEKDSSIVDSDEKIKIINQIQEILNYIKVKKFVKLIPEVRTNIAGALYNAIKREDVAGIDGRITIVDGMPKAAGNIKFGTAEHTSRLILTTKKFDSSINFVMNLRYNPELIQAIQKKTDLEMFEVIRENEREENRKMELTTMQWLVKKSFDKKGKIPDIIWDKGAIGKEPMIRLFAKNSNDMITKLSKILDLINSD